MSEKRPRVELRQARKALGLSQRKAALLAGYTAGSAWCQIENGTNTPSLDRMVAIAKIVQRPVGAVFPELQEALQGGDDESETGADEGTRARAEA